MEALGGAVPLYALPHAQAAAVATNVLGRFARDVVFQHWLRAQEATLLDTAVCSRDELPARADVDLTAFVPFLGA